MTLSKDTESVFGLGKWFEREWVDGFEKMDKRW